MNLFDTKVANDNVELKGEIDAASLVLTQKISLLPLVEPVLNKLKDIIPGHFDDDLIDQAIAKVKAL